MTVEYPDDLKYLDSHEYVRLDGPIATIGITHYAVLQLGDIVLVDLPKEGEAIEKGEPIGAIESVKAVSELFAPVSGTVIEVNTALEGSPELVNDEPYGKGWMVKVRVNNPDTALAGTFDANEYERMVDGLI